MWTSHYGILILLLLVKFGEGSWTVGANKNGEINETEDSSEEGEESKAVSRNDLPELSDEVLRSFFDFTSTDDDDDIPFYDKSFEAEKKYAMSEKPYSPYDTNYNYNGKKSQLSLYHKQPVTKEVVTLGSHFKAEKHLKSAGNVVNDYKKNYTAGVQSAVVGPYQISVVGSDSPLLTSLGLRRSNARKSSEFVSTETKETSNDTLDLDAFDTVSSAAYAHPPNHHHNVQNLPENYSYGYDHSKFPSGERYQNEPTRHDPNYQSFGSPGESHLQSKQHFSQPIVRPHTAYKHQHVSTHNAPPYGTKYAPRVWKPTLLSDYHDKSMYDDNKSDLPKYNTRDWLQKGELYPPHPPPLPYKNPPEKLYSSSSPLKPPLGTASATNPKNENTRSKPLTKQSYRYGHFVNSPGKLPSSAESASYNTYTHHIPAAKPVVNIRLKAKPPTTGVSIPINFNPLEVVKKLAMPLSALNPLANKKVTIGITIENKRSGSDTHTSIIHY